MVCEGLFNLLGTSSEEIIANAGKVTDEKINELTVSKDPFHLNRLRSFNKQLTSSNKSLSSEIDRLKELLK